MSKQRLLRRYLPFYGKFIAWRRFEDAASCAGNLYHTGPRPKRKGISQKCWDIDEKDGRAARKEARAYLRILKGEGSNVH